MILKGYLFSFLYVILCVLLAMLAYKLGSPKKYTRKIVHILVGFEWVILYHFIPSSIHSIVICVVFTLLLLISYLKKLMPMMSSDGDNDPGTVYYGVAMTVMAVISYFNPDFSLAFGIAVFCTSFGDGFAGVFGSLSKRYNVKIYNNKTLVGYLSGVIFSFLSVMVFSAAFELQISALNAFVISVLCSGVELISRFGLDNLFIPLSTSAVSYLVIFNSELLWKYILPIVITPYVVAFVLSKGILTPKGVVIALFMDLAVSVAFGNFGFIYLLAFLLLSVVVDKLKKRLNRKNDEVSKKGDKRDGLQVLANGLIPSLMAVIYICTHNSIFIVAYCAGLAEAFSDTCASGFGVLSKKTYDVTRFKPIKGGLSGGVSLIGTIASFIAAIIFPMIAVAFGVLSFKFVLIVGACAFLGALFDSVLGSLLQVKYRCDECTAITEKIIHCDRPTVYHSGVKWIDNDVVNLFSTLFAVIVAMVVYVLMQ